LVNLKREKDIPLHFVTRRFMIRRYVLEDDQSLFEAATESVNEVYPFLPWCHPDYCLEDSRGWLRTIASSWKDKQSYAFAITDGSTGRFLGGCGLNSLDENPVANLGYWIRSSEINKGIASESTRGLLKFGFEHLGLIRIEIMMSTRNPASQKVAIGANAKLEGTLRNRLQLHGENHDALLYSLVPEDMITDPDSG
jgi:RimJ/RimL family protein N-acetyltransferase